MTSCGMRVVRGPDWSKANADGGEGHIGTIIGENSNDRTGTVLWDNGSQSNCSLGKGGKYELRVLDNAPIGT